MQIGYSKYKRDKRINSLSVFTRKLYDTYRVVGWEAQRSSLPKVLVLLVAFTLIASTQSLFVGIPVFILAYLLYKAL